MRTDSTVDSQPIHDERDLNPEFAASLKDDPTEDAAGDARAAGAADGVQSAI